MKPADAEMQHWHDCGSIDLCVDLNSDDQKLRSFQRFEVMQAASLVGYKLCNKQWPVAHYAKVAGTLARRGIQVVLTGGGSELGRRCAAEVARGVDSPRVL